MFQNIDFGNNISNIIIDINLKKDTPLEEQIYELKEDLIQVVYNNGYIIDVGWYPEFDANGEFKILLIKDFNWNNPVIKSCSKDINKLEQIIKKYIKIIQDNKSNNI